MLNLTNTFNPFLTPEGCKEIVPIECRYCGGVNGAVTEGKGPHSHQIICVQCLKHIKWANFDQVKQETKDAP